MFLGTGCILVCIYMLKKDNFLFDISTGLLITSLLVGAAEYCDEPICVFRCLYVCLPTSIPLLLHAQSLPYFLCMLPVAVAWSSFDDVAILLTTSNFMDVVFADSEP